MRKDPLVNESYYHVINRSIAQYKIFNDNADYLRTIEIFDLYRFSDFRLKYSYFSHLSPSDQKRIVKQIKQSGKMLIEIIAYCLMPTHIHLLLKQNEDGGISKFMSKILNSYTRYFNTKHQRLGPLWEGRFKNVLVQTDEQLLHLTRYIHLNPVSVGLVKKPEDWVFSSYHEYIKKNVNKICQFEEIINLDYKAYKKFVHDRIAYQKELSKIKRFLIESYTG